MTPSVTVRSGTTARPAPIPFGRLLRAEWRKTTGTRAARWLLAAVPRSHRRARVLAAKVAAGLGISLVGAVYALAATGLVVTAARAAGRGIAVGWNWPQLAGFAVFVLLTSAVGIAFGALLHNTAVAIVTYFALAGAFSLLMIPALETAGNWINTGQTYGWVLRGQWAGHAAQIATSTVLWVILPLVLGLLRTLRREVR